MLQRILCIALFLALAINATAWATHSINVRVLDTRTRNVVSYEALIEASSVADAVFVGELHDIPWHHSVQLTIIDGLRKKDRPVAVGLEMFRALNQETLDRWVGGDLSEREMARSFKENWDVDWDLYRPIFEYARANGIPMVALNVPRRITQKVAANGFEALTREDHELLPVAVTCTVDKRYREFIKRATRAHGAESPKAFDRYCEAQLLWDRAMAWYARDHMKRNPGTRIVVLSGNNHAWRQGIPAHLNEDGDAFSSVVILPQLNNISLEIITPDDGDFVILD